MENIVDTRKRPLQDLRISVTDRCNFRCTYCMPKELFGKDHVFMPKEHLLSFEEIERLASIFVDFGVKKIRVTGGEPLLRKDIDVLINKLTKIDGLDDIGLTTNGIHLVKQAEKLKNAGLTRVNISLDALDDAVFKSINDRGVSPSFVLKGIDKAVEVGMEVKVNMVVKKGMNDQEILPMASYFKERDIPLRFIEFMDVGQSNGWDFSHVVTKRELYDQLHAEYELEPIEPAYLGEVAKRYRYKGTDTEVGFITSVSESFCSSCTRGRIAADGHFYNCLFATKGFDLKTLLRSGMDDQGLKEKIIGNWERRSDQYSAERTAETVKHRNKIEMSYIGG